MRLPIDLSDTRVRIALAAVLIACVTVAGWLGRGGSGEDSASLGRPLFPGESRGARAWGTDELFALLNSADGKAVSGQVLDALMRDPELRARWETLTREGRTKHMGAGLALLQGEPGFAALLQSLKKDPKIQEQRAKLEAEHRGGPQSVGDRMLVGGGAGGDATAPAPVPDQPSPQPRLTPPSAADMGPSALLASAGLPAPIQRMPLEQRSALVTHMEEGKRLDAACKDAGLSPQCAAVKQECSGDAFCADWMRVRFGAAAVSPAGTTAQTQPRRAWGAAAKAPGTPPLDDYVAALAAPGLPAPAAAAPPAADEPPPTTIVPPPPPAGPNRPPAPSRPSSRRPPSGDSTEPPPASIPPSEPEPAPQPEPEPEPEPPPPPARPATISCRDDPDQPKCNRCIAVGTLVRVPDGERAIETLVVGDTIVSIDERTGAPMPVRVVRVLNHGEGPTLLIRLDDGRSLVATGEHPLYDPELPGYRPASTFKAGHALLSSGSGGISAVRIVAIAPGPRRRVLDISVDGPHRNFVAGGLIVHNKNPITRED